MKAVRRKTILLVVAMMLVLSLTVGLTIAYFSDYTSAKGGLTVTLSGETKIYEEQYDNKKVITIENTGDTDVIVRVAVYGPVEINFSGEGWTNGGDGYYYYNGVLPPHADKDSSTTELTAEWIPPEDLGDDYSVVVVQESEMAVYDANGKVMKPDTKPAWAVLPSAN